MLPARFEQASFSLAEINNAKFTRPAVSSGMSVGSFPEQRLVIEPIYQFPIIFHVLCEQLIVVGVSLTSTTLVRKSASLNKTTICLHRFKTTTVEIVLLL